MGTRKQFGIAEFRGKAFRLTWWALNWAGIVPSTLAVLARLWSAPAERSGDGALALPLVALLGGKAPSPLRSAGTLHSDSGTLSLSFCGLCVLLRLDC